MPRGLVLPYTPDVEKQVAQGGSSITFLQIALGIVNRIELVLDVVRFGDELRFVRDCLEGGHEQTLLPCSITQLKSEGGPRRSVVAGYHHASLDDDDMETPRSSIAKDALGDAYDDADESALGNTASFNVTRCQSSLRGRLASTSLREQRQGSKETSDATAEHQMFSQGVPWLGAVVPEWPVDGVDTASLHRLFKDQMDCWTFDLTTVARLTNHRPLMFVGWEALRRSGCFSEFNFNPEKICRFLKQTESAYLTEARTAYHNNLHAADVTQSLWAMLVEMRADRFYDPMDTTSSLLSAIVHDMGHDGLNNAFHIGMQDELALAYNDKSVLESYHLVMSFRLFVVNPETNFLQELPKDQYAIFRRQIIDMVLGTDMSQHFAKLGSFADFHAKLGSRPTVWNSDECANALRSMLLHLADISNQAKPIGVAHMWAVRVLKEFFVQGDMEKSRGLPISPLCDRSQIDISASQVGFIDFIVTPSYEVLATVVPMAAARCLPELTRNRENWKKTTLSIDDVEGYSYGEKPLELNAISLQPIIPLLFKEVLMENGEIPDPSPCAPGLLEDDPTSLLLTITEVPPLSPQSTVDPRGRELEEISEEILEVDM